jgi:hypothetical protein
MQGKLGFSHAVAIESIAIDPICRENVFATTVRALQLRSYSVHA